jgi:hypothetical protein
MEESMKLKLVAIPFVTFLALIALAGCNLPLNQTPTPIVFPTPNLTLTAIFAPPVTVPPTVTPNPIMTATQPSLPTALPTQGGNSTATPPAATTSPTQAASLTPVVAGRPASTASYLSSAPSVNGDWGEWTTTEYPIKSVVYGATNWSGSADLQGAYRVGWDATNLYLAVKVTDDKYVQNSSGDNLYKGDSLELLLDSNLAGDAAMRSLSVDDYQLGISPGNPSVGSSPEAYLWFPANKKGKLTNVQIGAVAMTGGYRVEVAIPWSVFGVTPSSGQQYGFAVSVSDNDNTSANVQQSMISSAPDRSLVDPTTWGVLTLNK